MFRSSNIKIHEPVPSPHPARDAINTLITQGYDDTLGQSGGVSLEDIAALMRWITWSIHHAKLPKTADLHDAQHAAQAMASLQEQCCLVQSALSLLMYWRQATKKVHASIIRGKEELKNALDLNAQPPATPGPQASPGLDHLKSEFVPPKPHRGVSADEFG